MKLRELMLNIENYLGKEVVLEGWVKKIRAQKNFGFIEFNDGTYFLGLQLVFDETISNFEEISKLTIYSTIKFKGIVVKSEGKGQDYEIKVSNIEVFSKNDENYPLQNKRHGVEFLRTISHLRPRTNTFNAVFRVRSILSFAIHKYFNERNFMYIHTPIITGIDAEGAGEILQVTRMDMDKLPLTEDSKVDYKEDFFGKKSFLTVTGQLHVEAFCSAFSNTYTFGPTFRAEDSFTPRHAAEFWMIEPEMAFVDLDANMDVVEDFIKYIIRYLLENAPLEMEFFDKFIEKGLLEKLNLVLNNKFERITYTKAIEVLKNSNRKFEIEPNWGIDLKSEHEKYLAEEVFKKPVFVTDYPKDFKAFYMKQNEDGKTVRAMDLLAPGIGEIVGGSQREDNYDKLINIMQEKGLNPEDYKWYVDLRKYGSFIHSGFGLGFERMLMYVTGMSNIRDVSAFPRTAKNLEY